MVPIGTRMNTATQAMSGRAGSIAITGCGPLRTVGSGFPGGRSRPAPTPLLDPLAASGVEHEAVRLIPLYADRLANASRPVPELSRRVLDMQQAVTG